MHDHTYLFYDIETTGLNKCFDQVLQFAAIRTNESLSEIDRHEFQIKLNPDVIPSPYAIITHRIGVSDFSKGLSEYEAVQKIHALLNHPGTISVGYNSLGFDDEFLRFSFYKNLLPPYTHQFANGCGRMDIYPITLLYSLFKKELLNWPEGNLKLENINAANQLHKGQAHNAMVDVEVTLALARKLIQDKTLWSFIIDYFGKKTDGTRLHHCDTHLKIGDDDYKIGLMVNGNIGTASGYIAPVIELGMHAHYKNQLLWLRLDDEQLLKTKIDTIKATTRVFKKRLAEPPIFLPLKDRYLSLLSDERQQKMVMSKKWLMEHVDLFRAIQTFHQEAKYPEIKERDCDAALYDIGFPTPIEEKLFQQFHAAAPSEKMLIAKKFPNKIRREQALRIIARHFPDFLSSEDKVIFEHYRTANPVDFRGEKKLTVEQAMSEIEKIKLEKKLDAEQIQLLNDLLYQYEKKYDSRSWIV